EARAISRELGEDALGLALAIDVGVIEEVDALLERGFDRCPGERPIGVGEGRVVPRPSEGHAAVGDPGADERGGPERLLLHDSNVERSHSKRQAQKNALGGVWAALGPGTNPRWDAFEARALVHPLGAYCYGSSSQRWALCSRTLGGRAVSRIIKA